MPKDGDALAVLVHGRELVISGGGMYGRESRM